MFSAALKTAVTSAAEFAGIRYHTSLPSHCLTTSGSLSPFTCLCEKSLSRKSVDWHTQHVAKPAQPMECDQFIHRGLVCKKYIFTEILTETSDILRTKDYTEWKLAVFILKLRHKQRHILICKQIWFRERLTWDPAEALVCDVFRQLNVLHQATSCLGSYDIRDFAIHVYICNALLIRLLKAPRQPTNGFALLGAHQAQSPGFRQPYVLLETKLHGISEILSLGNEFGAVEEFSANL
ncbi:LOW QUALITY PROTEIN: hypothetical protein T265_13889 [Opisthorchis viverrini]|uniref:Uncharacterized protein n=1 Tax=Opisthorchis viverrini TaxID=6198 RepID=A0A075AES5_OPIVI|nr:LOW QUALITY PROTEIN: hypothetical protein T265_13889 [Opisthorchis viverrini]KER27014.1 LOW QUALITY PROTEIN: hypothetical protein T265_13889 [Opisthorchis viverrini]